ncbi:MAG: NAD-dependent epimerase/dehydratase family protein [Dehalococcoidia bacterium]|nr:NAD-dependent epimerase/dehydratase family protein [Dehalococcoidia bacterium]MDW8119891.1 NAD-dependent epimerase/dehydratase family protein [Chloroflexota bacterium]
MKIFITGIAGFLGSNLAEALIAQGHSVAGNDNLIGGEMDNLPQGVEFHPIDCNDWQALSKAMQGAEVVYHCAATPHEGLSVFSPALVAKHVYLATASTLSAAVQAGVRRFIYCSSMARYGDNPIPFTEDMPTRPVDPYGISKVAGEDLVKLMAEVHKFEYVIAVPHNIYGPRQKYDDPYRNVVAIFINRMLQGKQPYIFGDGNQRRCFSYISDVIDPLIRMAFQDNVVGEVINIGPDDEFVTINHLAEIVAEAVGFELDPIYVPERPQEVREATCSAMKARRLLGYTPRVPLRQGVAQMVEWVRAKGPRPFRYHLGLEIITERTPKVWVHQLYA